jgi:hypothetical protein
VQQSFEAGADGLSQVAVRFATGRTSPRCRVDVVVTEGTRRRAAGAIGCDRIDDNELASIRFAPLADSRGRRFTIAVSVATPVRDGVVGLWGGPPVAGLPPATIDGAAIEHAVELHTGYGDDRWAFDQLDTAFDRLAQYGPPWREPLPLGVLAIGALAVLVAATVARGRWALVLVVVFALLKGTVWSAVLPTFEGPDEPAHVAYAQFMAVEHSLPERGTNRFGLDNIYSEEMNESGAAFNVAASPPGDRPTFGDAAAAAVHDSLDEAGRRANGNGAAAGYSPFYYLGPAVLHGLPGTLDVRVGTMRLWSVALGAAAVALAFLIGRRLFDGSDAAGAALAIAVAAAPTFSQQTAIVNNDALVIVLGCACILVALELARPQASRRMALVAGLVGGAAIVAKPFGAAFLPALGVAWLIGRARERAIGSRAVGDAARAIGGLVATYGMWAAVTTLAGWPTASPYSDAASDEPATIGRYVLLYREARFAALRDRWIDHLWARLSWLDLDFPAWVRVVLTTVTVVVLVLLVVVAVRTLVGWVRRRVPGPRDVDDATAGLWVVVAIVASVLATLHVADFLQFRQLGRIELLQGRYALMAMPAIVVAPALIVRALSSPKIGAAVLAVLAAGLVVLNVVGLDLLVERFYL